MRSWVLAFAMLMGCGQVDKLPPDAAKPDAYQPDGATTCASGQMVCGGACEDVMSSSAHCGSCTTECNPVEYCGAGTCKRFASCADYKASASSLPNGFYISTAVNNVNFYCDFTDGYQYTDFAVMGFTTPPTGYEVARATDFQNPGFAAAFIAFYNRTSGIHTFAAFTESNCCYSPVAGLRYMFGGAISTTYKAGASTCNQPHPLGEIMQMSIGSLGVQTTIPANAFTTNAPTEGANCSDGNNPAFYFQRTMF